MATYYVDKYATGAADGSSWEDAWTDTTTNYLVPTTGDIVLIKSYGPDDPYTDLSPIYCIRTTEDQSGVSYIGDDGTGTGEAPSYRMCYFEPAAGNSGIGTRPITTKYLAFVGVNTAYVLSSAGGGHDIVISHCKTIACTTRGISITDGGDVTVEWYEDYNAASFLSINLASANISVCHLTSFSNTSSAVRFDSNCEAASVTCKGNLSLDAGADDFEVNALTQWADGSPDYNHVDHANRNTTYQPNLSEDPEHDVYGITDAAYLPYTAYGILVPTRGFPGEDAGHDGRDVGAHDQEYAVQCYPTYSCEVQTTTPTRNENGALLRIGTDTQVWRVGVTYDIESLPAGIWIEEAWAALYIHTLSSGDAQFNLYPYAGLGYNRDPETDGDSALATLFGYLDDGPKSPAFTTIGDGASTGATGQYAYLLEIDRINELLEEARRKGMDRFSIGIRLDDESVDHFHIDGTGSGTEARKPRLIVVYTPGLSVEQQLLAAVNKLRRS